MRMRSQHLSHRVTAIIWTVCAVILAIFGLFFYVFERQQRQTQIEQAKVLLDTVYKQKHEDLANELFARHMEALQLTIAEILKVKGIAAINIFNAEGVNLASVGVYQCPDMSAESLRLSRQGDRFEEKALADRPGIVYHSPIQVIGRRVGYYCAFFDLSDMQRASQHRIILIVAVFSSLLVVLSMVLHMVLTFSVIRPVSGIRHAMEQVMRGRLGEQVHSAHQDEIGQMAQAFNAMSAQLSEQHERLTRSVAARDSYAQQLEDTNRKLARLNADLETIVEERTRDLRNSYESLQNEIQERIRADRERHVLEERLARSKKMEALGLLAGGVAHDLNNVLSGIVSYPELMLMDLPQDHPLRPMVETVQRSGQKAAAIVQDLLALARRGVSHMEVLNLNQDVIADYLASPEFKKLTSYHPDVALITRLDENLLNVRGSAVHLKKALMNLVSNAAEAQGEGGQILISTCNRYVDRPFSGYEHVLEGDYVVLGVEDKGSGIAPEDLDRIFEPFYTKKVMGRSGTGLGMAVVWGTVQDHQGYINVESRLERGTTFEIYLPVTRERAAAPAAPPQVTDYMGKGETVLVVDDVAEQRHIAASLLRRLNYNVFTVASGEEAVAFLQTNQADILVLDMIMDPGMDGLDTYQEILAFCPDQKAVIASGYAESDRVKQAQQLGAGAYIRKPYAMEKIGLALRAELEHPSGG